MKKILVLLFILLPRIICSQEQVTTQESTAAQKIIKTDKEVTRDSDYEQIAWIVRYLGIASTMLAGTIFNDIEDSLREIHVDWVVDLIEEHNENPIHNERLRHLENAHYNAYFFCNALAHTHIERTVLLTLFSHFILYWTLFFIRKWEKKKMATYINPDNFDKTTTTATSLIGASTTVVISYIATKWIYKKAFSILSEWYGNDGFDHYFFSNAMTPVFIAHIVELLCHVICMLKPYEKSTNETVTQSAKRAQGDLISINQKNSPETLNAEDC